MDTVSLDFACAELAHAVESLRYIYMITEKGLEDEALPDALLGVWEHLIRIEDDFKREIYEEVKDHE